MTDGENCSRKCGSGDHKHQAAPCIPIVRLFTVLFFFENGDIDGIEFTITIKICRVMIQRKYLAILQSRQSYFHQLLGNGGVVELIRLVPFLQCRHQMPLLGLQIATLPHQGHLVSIPAMVFILCPRYSGRFNLSRNCLLGRKLIICRLVMVIDSPVFGLRPRRGDLSRTFKLPNWTSLIDSP